MSDFGFQSIKILKVIVLALPEKLYDNNPSSFLVDRCVEGGDIVQENPLSYIDLEKNFLQAREKNH